MRKPIVIFTIGTLEDVRPCVALGRGLLRAGYPVRMATSGNFAGLVRDAGLEYSPLTADFQAMLESERSIADHGMNLREMARIFRDRYTKWAANWFHEGVEAAAGGGLLIGASNGILLAKALSEALSIPFAIARLQPMTRSRTLPPVMFAGSRRKWTGILSLAAYHRSFRMLWGMMRPAINDIVRPQLGLPGYPWYGPYFRELHRAHAINGFSQHVLPRPADWPDTCQVTGYWFFDQPHWTPPAALSQFLKAGPKPIYIGFGSMVGSNATAFTETVLDGVKRSSQRAVLATGWGALDGEDGDRDGKIFFLRQAPHDAMFPLMSAAVHHGGAGATAAAVRAGIPSVIVPFFGDQRFWAHCLHRKGVAPPLLDRKTMTANMLASAMNETQQPAMLQTAAALGRLVRAEDGIAEAVRRLREWNLLPETEPLAADDRAVRSAT